MAKVTKFKKRDKDEDDEKPVKKGKSEKRTSEGKANPGNRYTGVTSGLGVTEFQNKTILDNPKKKLTDEAIAKLWRKEFPKAKAYTAEDVAGVRSMVNRGTHGNEAPAKLVHGYDDEGEALPLRGEKSAAKKAAAKAKATAVKTVRGKGKAKASDEDEEEESDEEEAEEESEDEESEEEDSAEEEEEEEAPRRRRVAK